MNLCQIGRDDVNDCQGAILQLAQSSSAVADKIMKESITRNATGAEVKVRDAGNEQSS